MIPTFTMIDLGRMAYAPAFDLQSVYLEKVLAARDDAAIESDTRNVGYVLLVEHDPPVITITRRPAAASHLLALPDALQRDGIEVAPTDRGGDITYHGPGQLVVYPILDLNLLKLRLHDYMRLLEAAVIDTCGAFGVPAHRDSCATGVWVGASQRSASLDTSPERQRAGTRVPGFGFRVSAAGSRTPEPESPLPDTQCSLSEDECGPGASPDAKICALGVRVRRWISMHGLALNVTTNLDHFKHIVPCGLTGRPVTSLKEQLGDRCPSMQSVKQQLLRVLEERLGQHVRTGS